LHTVLERLLDQLSFDACDRSGESIVIDEAYVDSQLSHLLESEDLGDYIL